MTSPMQPKPEATSDRYSDIHSVGSSFGQDLKNEAQVRQLLMGKDNGGSVFARAVKDFTQNVVGFVTELFSPDGASYHVITDAVTGQLGPINNAITLSGERHDELAGRVDDLSSEQEDFVEEARAQLATADTKIADLTDSIDTKIEAQLKASDYLDEELGKVSTSVTHVDGLVRTQNPFKWTEDWDVGSSITKTDTHMFMSAGGSEDDYGNRALTPNSVRLIPGHTYRIRAQGIGEGSIELGFYRTRNGVYSSYFWADDSVKTISGGFDHYVDWEADYPNEGEDGVQGVFYLNAKSDITVISVTVQDISDLALVQPQINEGFAMALRSHQALFESQLTWNEAQEAINRFNSTQWATQAEVDKAQNAAVNANTEAIALQGQINRSNQLMFWNHQNTLELLDIRSQKTWGWKEYINGEQSATYPESNVTCPYVSDASGWWRQSTPYFDYYSKADVGVLAAKGNWAGHVTVTGNWTNGAVDVWTVEINKQQRVFTFYGGAAHIKKRATSVEIQIENLNRTAHVSIQNGKWVEVSGEDNSLIRELNFGTDAELILRAPFLVSPPLVIRDVAGNKTDTSSGEIVVNTPIKAVDQSATTFTMTEASTLESTPFPSDNPPSNAPQVKLEAK